MEGGERSSSGLPSDYHHELQVSSFSAAPPPPSHHHHHPHAIPEMGFVQFEDHHQVLSFLAPSSQSCQMSQPLDHPAGGGAADNNHATTTSSTTNDHNNGSLGFSHNELITNIRPSWHSSDLQVGCTVLLPQFHCRTNFNAYHQQRSGTNVPNWSTSWIFSFLFL